jgi:hypothetical protein
MWSLWKARPRAPGRGVLSPGEYGSAEKSGREVRQREIRYLKPAEAAAHILGKCKENVFNGRPVGRPPRPPTAAAARRQPLLLAASRQQPLWTGPAAAGEAAARTTLLGATPHFSERFPFVNDCMFLFVSREVTQLYPPCSARATGDVFLSWPFFHALARARGGRLEPLLVDFLPGAEASRRRLPGCCPSSLRRRP